MAEPNRYRPGREHTSRTYPVVPPIYQTATFELDDRVMPGPHGAMLTLVLDGGDERARQVIRRLEVAVEATSLGGVETLASLPFNSSHFNMTPQQRIDAGIMPGMLRLSVGLEGKEALAGDLRQALKQSG